MTPHIKGEKYNVHLRFSPGDKIVLKNLANLHGMSYSQFVLMAIDEFIEKDSNLKTICDEQRQQFDCLEYVTVDGKIPIGERIQILRQQLHMSQHDLAVACGYKDRNSIYKIEKGMQKNIMQRQIIALSKALKVGPDVIMGWTPYRAVKCAHGALYTLDSVPH